MKQLTKSEKGLTLIEVLIALAILSIALTAVIHATTQTIKNTLYLQNKTIATWIASDIINSFRVGALQLAHMQQGSENQSIVLGQTWTWKTTIDTTPNPNIKQIEVTVTQGTQSNTLAHITSYLYAKK